MTYGQLQASHRLRRSICYLQLKLPNNAIKDLIWLDKNNYYPYSFRYILNSELVKLNLAQNPEYKRLVKKYKK